MRKPASLDRADFLTVRAFCKTHQKVEGFMHQFNSSALGRSMDGAMTGNTHDQMGSTGAVETRARRLQLFEGLTDVCFAMDADLRFTFWNKASEELVGIPEEEVLGKSWHDIFPPTTECARNAAEAYRRVLLKRTSEGFIINHLGSGRRLCLGVNAYPNPHGVTVIARDITERRRVEEALQQEKEKAQRYLNIVGTMVVAIDTDQTVSLINQAGCRLLGYSEAQIRGMNWFDHFLPERVREHVRKVFVQLMAGIVEPVDYVENVVLTRNGEERTIAWHSRILKDKMGHITGTISSGDDITELKQAEATLIESEQRVRRLNEHILNMVMVLSHDIRGPLVAIASILKLMLRGAYTESWIKARQTPCKNSCPVAPACWEQRRITSGKPTLSGARWK